MYFNASLTLFESTLFDFFNKERNSGEIKIYG